MVDNKSSETDGQTKSKTITCQNQSQTQPTGKHTHCVQVSGDHRCSVQRQTIKNKALRTEVLSQVLCNQPTASLQLKDKFQAQLVPYMGGPLSFLTMVPCEVTEPWTNRSQPKATIVLELFSHGSLQINAKTQLKETEVIFAQAFKGLGAAWWWAQLVGLTAGCEQVISLQ